MFPGKRTISDRKYTHQLENEALADPNHVVYTPEELIYANPKYVDMYEFI